MSSTEVIWARVISHKVPWGRTTAFRAGGEASGVCANPTCRKPLRYHSRLAEKERVEKVACSDECAHEAGIIRLTA